MFGISWKISWKEKWIDTQKINNMQWSWIRINMKTCSQKSLVNYILWIYLIGNKTLLLTSMFLKVQNLLRQILQVWRNVIWNFLLHFYGFLLDLSFPYFYIHIENILSFKYWFRKISSTIWVSEQTDCDLLVRNTTQELLLGILTLMQFKCLDHIKPLFWLLWFSFFVH